MEKIRVLYIAGSGRSGTTLLDRILGQIADIYSAGELRYIWERSFRENQLCGCGSPFAECIEWKRIVSEAFHGKDKILGKIDNIIGLQNSIDRIRYIPFFEITKFKENLLCFIDDYLYPLYLAIQKTTQKKIIVDSSKHPSYLKILSCCDFIDLYVIHLVRDSRAVAYSWQKKKVRPEVIDSQQYMPRYSPVSSSFHWLTHNYLIKMLSKKNKYLQVRYEEMVTEPRKTVENILKFLSLKDELSFFIDEYEIFLRSNHTVSGNPMRFKTGGIKLKLDLEWQDKMAPRDKYLVSLLTCPVMKGIISKS